MAIKSSVQLSIGAISFRIISQDTSVNQDYDPPYKQFLTSDTSTEAQAVSIRLLPKKDMPSLATLTKIFDTSQSWSMYSDFHDRYIVFHLPGSSNKPEWLARIDAGRHNIDIFCKNSKNPVRYPLDQILLINLLVGKGLLIHAAGMVIDSKGYLFAGPSGAGKSTICSLFKDADRCTMLSDDRIVVRKTGQEFFMYGTPWPGDAGIAVNDSAKLHGIFFLKHSSENKIKKLSISETLKYFFKVASLPLYDKTDMQKSLDFIEDLLKEVRTYELHFKPGPEIVAEVLSFVAV